MYVIKFRDVQQVEVKSATQEETGNMFVHLDLQQDLNFQKSLRMMNNCTTNSVLYVSCSSVGKRKILIEHFLTINYRLNFS